MMLWSDLGAGRESSGTYDFRARTGRGPNAWFGANTGYTIAEVLVAVVVTSIIAGAFYAALSSGFLVVQSSRDDLRATQILMQKIEGLRLCTWDQLASFSFREQYDPGSAKPGTAFVGSVAIAPASSIPDTAAYKNNVCVVTVSISWTNYNGKMPIPHTRQMQTQVARYGLQNYIWGAIR